MTSEQTAQLIACVLKDKKAKDIEVIDVGEKTILADHFVIATGSSITHIKALAGEVEQILKDQHARLPDHIEGYSTGRWILMDYADVVVHLFHSEERSFYNLEKLWRAART